jgi:hypothetical protein
MGRVSLLLFKMRLFLGEKSKIADFTNKLSHTRVITMGINRVHLPEQFSSVSLRFLGFLNANLYSKAFGQMKYFFYIIFPRTILIYSV